ncbi:nuclear transport factor 2 family protein [Micromonospora sp. NPDC048898]|uniref:nuclear transport factor 2 family protein n=1 Tax=Micromonospora sp. NPDC048898 TaxID=3364260 RepID=UPI00371570AA
MTGSSTPYGSGVIGGRFLADLGALVVELHFETRDRLTFTIRDGGGLTEPGYTETVATKMIEIRPGVYFTSWVEKSGATVTHLEDFVTGTLHSNATLPNGGGFFEMTGTITPLDAPVQPTVDNAARNKEIVLTAMRELFVEGDTTAVDRYWREPYVQHSPQLPNGLETLRTVVPTLVGFTWEPHRIVAEGDLVMAHSLVHGWAPTPVVIVDIFRLEDERIVEHWDVIQEVVPTEKSANGNPMI